MSFVIFCRDDDFVKLNSYSVLLIETPQQVRKCDSLRKEIVSITGGMMQVQILLEDLSFTLCYCIFKYV